MFLFVTAFTYLSVCAELSSAMTSERERMHQAAQEQRFQDAENVSACVDD